MTIFGVTLQVMAGWNISWECSVPLNPINLFVRVNKEGLCHGIKVEGKVILVVSFLWFLEWRKKRHFIINLLNTFLFQAGVSTIPHNLPLQIDNANLCQSTFNMIMHAKISYWGKNDLYNIGHFYPNYRSRFTSLK